MRFDADQARAGRDDQGSMPMALLVTLVGMALSAALVPFVVSQVSSTRTIDGAHHALQAAQAGIDVALGQLRAAGDHGGTGGDLESLPPCTMGPARRCPARATAW